MEINQSVYVIRLLWVFPGLRRNIASEIHTYFSTSPLLLAALPASLSLYNPQSAQLTLLPRPQTLPTDSLLLLLNYRVAAVFNAAEVTNQVFTVSLGSNTVRQLPVMLSTRKRPAVVQSAGVLYLFGGWDGSYLRDCERLSLLEGQWRPLPQLTARCSSLCPAKYKGDIYLQRRYTLTYVEVFNIHTLTFRELKVVGKDRTIGWLPMCFVFEEELIVLSDKESFWRGSIAGDSEISLQQSKKIRTASPISFACLPVLVGSQAFWLDTQGVLQTLDINTQTLTGKSIS